MPHSVASDLGLHCLPLSHKKDARLIWVKWNVKYQVINSNFLVAYLVIWGYPNFSFIIGFVDLHLGWPSYSLD